MLNPTVYHMSRSDLPFSKTSGDKVKGIGILYWFRLKMYCEIPDESYFTLSCGAHRWQHLCKQSRYRTRWFVGVVWWMQSCIMHLAAQELSSPTLPAAISEMERSWFTPKTMSLESGLRTSTLFGSISHKAETMLFVKWAFSKTFLPHCSGLNDLSQRQNSN